jgi:hypothetical protein
MAQVACQEQLDVGTIQTPLTANKNINHAELGTPASCSLLVMVEKRRVYKVFV